ncbi:hypothetical protein L6452_13748 [Arctium lappa]|uniref:Uncharacterized protein n=1 Tax=Arctium lappa TaxID=4217 RepID=A0ACB9CJE9_ARCLA|nr:hypothetical protein L6452_13748 [Arctium lappa]
MRTPWISNFCCFLILLCYSAIAQRFVYPSANLSNTWISNKYGSNSIVFSDGSRIIPILLKETDESTQFTAQSSKFLCGLFCNGTCTSFIFSIFIVHRSVLMTHMVPSHAIWSANQDNPIREGATLNLTVAGELVLHDVDGTKVWTTNTTGKSVVGMNLTSSGNLVLFNVHNLVVWQSFDHPKDCLLPGQNLFQGQKLISSVSSTNWTKGQYSLQVTDEGLFAYVESNPPQVYASIGVQDPSTHKERSYIRFLNGSLSFFGEPTHPTILFPLSTSPLPQYLKLMPDGHFQVFQWQDGWTVVRDLLTSGDCLYPLACGRNAICSANQQCSCPRSSSPGIDYFKPINNQQPNLGCSEITPLTCSATQDQVFIVLKNIKYSTFTTNLEKVSMEACKQACLNNCSCKAALFRYGMDGISGDCFLPSDLFTIISLDIDEVYYKASAFIKVQNVKSPQTPSRKNRVATILRPTIASIVVLVIVVSGFIMFIVHKQKRNVEMEEEYLDQVPGMPTRFSYEELKIATKCFSKKLGKGGFGSVFEGTLEDGSNIAVKCLEGPAHAKKSFLAEVESIGSIHHVNLVTLKGFCALKSQPLLVYEFMSNGSLDRWIYHGNREHKCWEEGKLLDIVDRYSEDMQANGTEVVEMMKVASWCLQTDFKRRPSMSLVIKVLEGVMQVESNLDYNFTDPRLEKTTIRHETVLTQLPPSFLSGPRKNFDISQPEESRHLLTVFQKHWEQGKLLDIIDKYSEDMQAHGPEVVEMMKLPFKSWLDKARASMDKSDPTHDPDDVDVKVGAKKTSDELESAASSFSSSSVSADDDTP